MSQAPPPPNFKVGDFVICKLGKIDKWNVVQVLALHPEDQKLTVQKWNIIVYPASITTGDVNKRVQFIEPGEICEGGNIECFHVASIGGYHFLRHSVPGVEMTHEVYMVLRFPVEAGTLHLYHHQAHYNHALYENLNVITS